MRRTSINHQAYHINLWDIICGQMSVWDRVALWFILIRPGITRTVAGPTPTHANDMVLATSFAFSSNAGCLKSLNS